jgi:cell shape-determining protein MreC
MPLLLYSDFMETQTPPPSPNCPLLSSTTASWPLHWGQRLSWLISALSGTLEIEAETERLKQENARLNAMILQTRKEKGQIENETKQIEKENERLAELESKIDSLFSKYGITSNLVNKPQQP